MKKIGFNFFDRKTGFRITSITIATALILGLTLTAAHAGYFWPDQLTGDTDSGISDTKTYTHAYNLGNGATDTVVNGVTFIGNGNTTPSAFNFSTAGFPSSHVTSPSSHIAGGIGDITSSFTYGVANDLTQTVTLTDLVIGQQYTTTFYNKSWGDACDRRFAISTSDGTEYVFDENFNADTTGNDGGDGIGNMLHYSYTATATSLSFVFSPENLDSTFHFYGFTNETGIPESIPTAGSFSVSSFTGDADCGISNTKVYTHAYDINGGTGDLVINGVTFTGVNGVTVNPAASNFSTAGMAMSINEMLGDLGPSANISGDIAELTSGFNFSPTPSWDPQTLILTGLEIGKEYKTTFYCMTWGEEGDRILDVSTSQGDLFTFDENLNSTGDASGNGVGNMLTYSYTAMDTELSIAFSPAFGFENGLHFYGFTNEEIAVKVPGDANNDGRVDGSDVTILAGNWQVGVGGVGGASWEMGDFNGDGAVDGSDVTILAGNWQYGVIAVATSVPEPNIILLLITTLASLLGIRQR